ncbi:M15 family metallopeptidase [Cysteiniphilum sp. 6C5]|uniref:M15 family metallopeptidase n=1 Tax=unclassified Cysteiniphilum TaxID=2610889 RepID=UPI003F83AA38
MKIDFRLSLSLLLISVLFQSSFAGKIETVVATKPKDFVNIKEIVPSIQVNMRYFSDNNFVGKVIKGYQAPLCLLTKEAALGIKKVQNKLLPMGLSLKVYDCYRPQMAVDNFADWAKSINDNKMKAQHYPDVDKKDLFLQGYIDYRSGHSRGSTVDLTIVPLNSENPKYIKKAKLISCTAPKESRAPDNSLDFGTGFDCFSPVSHPNYQNLSPQIKANRLLLQTLMMDAGFKPLNTEWWHFTLLDEPYPNTYFNFPIKKHLGE